ncbi:hypothetical protein Tco_1543399, partial [Tanacetum coccineum]
MTRMGFESKWCRWVEACLKSSLVSILVNGSSLEEFGVEKGIVRGVRVGSNQVMVSHLQYADDIIFFGEWNSENVKALMSILRCFEEVLGLQVNFNNSKLYGLGVSDEELGSMASGMGCDIVDKFKNCLADWKAKTMSFGGRLTLVKLVLDSLPLYYFSMFRVPASVLKNLERIRKNFFWGGIGDGKKISWVKWNSIPASFEDRGLNMGSLRAENLALLGKWWWRFRTEGGGFWVKVIKSIHGACGAWVIYWGRGVWHNIMKCGIEINGLGLEFTSSCLGVLDDGKNVRFWEDRWIDYRRLRNRFPRFLHLD